MTYADVRAAVDDALGPVPTTITHEYCAAVRDLLRALLPADAKIDVYHRLTEVVVAVQVGGVSATIVTPLG